MLNINPDGDALRIMPLLSRISEQEVAPEEIANQDESWRMESAYDSRGGCERARGHRDHPRGHHQ